MSEYLQLYEKITCYILNAGKRLQDSSTDLQDIGIKKDYVTKEDLRIERDLKELIHHTFPDHGFYAEEENNVVSIHDHTWIVDPISGTSTLLQGEPHYAIVLSHIYKGITQFAVVYDPSADELFTAYKDKGSFVNGTPLKIVPTTSLPSRILLLRTSALKGTESYQKLKDSLHQYEICKNGGSVAVSECMVATGIFDGAIILAKDSFPHFAGGLIIQEAGGFFTNEKGEKDISPQDRYFVMAKTEELHRVLLNIKKESKHSSTPIIVNYL